MKFCAKLIGVAAVVMLTACSSMSLCGKKDTAEKSADEIKALEMPPDLISGQAQPQVKVDDLSTKK